MLRRYAPYGSSDHNFRCGWTEPFVGIWRMKPYKMRSLLAAKQWTWSRLWQRKVCVT